MTARPAPKEPDGPEGEGHPRSGETVTDHSGGNAGIAEIT
jgi:hypothetical protein